MAILFKRFKRWLDVANCLDDSFDRYDGKTSASLIKVEEAFNKIYPKYRFKYAIHNLDCDNCCCDYGKWCVMTITCLEANKIHEYEEKWMEYSVGNDNYLHKLIVNK